MTAAVIETDRRSGRSTRPTVAVVLLAVVAALTWESVLGASTSGAIATPASITGAITAAMVLAVFVAVRTGRAPRVVAMTTIGVLLVAGIAAPATLLGGFVVTYGAAGLVAVLAGLLVPDRSP